MAEKEITNPVSALRSLTVRDLNRALNEIKHNSPARTPPVCESAGRLIREASEDISRALLSIKTTKVPTPLL